MMLMNLFALLLLVAPLQFNVFKKDMSTLQATVDGLVTSTGSQVMQKSHAAFIEGYGVTVNLEVAFVAPQGIFDTPKKPAELRTLVAQRRKDVQEKLTAFVTQHVATTDSIGPSDSLAVVIHVMNTNPVDTPNLPIQIVLAARKESPQQVSFHEYF
jgi:hypothetical protein